MLKSSNCSVSVIVSDMNGRKILVIEKSINRTIAIWIKCYSKENQNTYEIYGLKS